MKLSKTILLSILIIVSCVSPKKKTNMKEVDRILTKEVVGNKTPSVQYIIFDKDTIIHKFQTGLADVKGQKTVNWHTTFKAFSVTKTFTALAILQLAENGDLDINKNANQYLPDFPYSPDITIKQLLTHSSGIPNPNPLSWIHLESERDSFDKKLFFNQLFEKHNKTKFAPNEKFSYTNFEYFLLGQVIEIVSGQTYEDYIRDHIIKPLGISPEELDFTVIDKNQHAKGYQKKFSFLNAILGFFMDKSKYMGKTEGKWKPFNNYYVNGPAYGGLIGRPDAFVTYIQELLKPGSQILSDDYKSMLFTENYTNSSKATGMCLSWFRGVLNGQEYFTHAGGGGGYYCEIRIYPRLGLGSVIMFNRSGMTDERVLDKLDKHFIDAYS